MNKKKLVYISYIAAPHQVKLCYAIQKYFDAEFWFYDYTGSRASWWRIDLGDKCKVLPNVLFKKSSRYITFSHLKELRRFDPDIVMLGGFSVPANYIAYLWARMHRKKTVVFSERSRTKKGVLRTKTFTWILLKFLYRHVDLIIVSAVDTVTQFRDTFGFRNKIVVAQYATDIDHYFDHSVRAGKEFYKYLFPNRLTDIYNPLLAIEIFAEILKEYPKSELYMNSAGELKGECERKIEELKLANNVFFLTQITSWDKLHEVYRDTDIMIFPAKFSNGNSTMIEAMASGMGIVLSNKILGIGKLIENGVNGFNCEPTKEEFLKCIKEYIRNPDLFRIHEEINRVKARPFSVESTALSYYEVISENVLK
jgi:glycosyltransferase involved in cell wall biosynthesis